LYDLKHNVDYQRSFSLSVIREIKMVQYSYG